MEVPKEFQMPLEEEEEEELTAKEEDIWNETGLDMFQDRTIGLNIHNNSNNTNSSIILPMRPIPSSHQSLYVFSAPR